MTTLSLPREAIRQQVSARRRTLAAARGWLRAHARSLAVLLPLLGVTAAIHLIGSRDFPRYVDDPGTYLSQAWSLRYEGQLSPYSYFYDHAPAGWIQIAAWALLTDGFDRYGSAMAFGTEGMLIAKLASTALLFALARRLGFTTLTVTLAGLLYAFCPLALEYGRWTFLDNIATPWLLAALYLAASPKRSIGAAAGACLAFAMAALSKETFLVFLPAFGWALARNLDCRNRPQVLTVAIFAGTLLMGMYPLMAIYKGELLPGPGHNSLLATAAWQLSGRQSTGSLADPDSAMRHLFGQWLSVDPYLVWGGAVAAVVAVFVRRLHPLAMAMALAWAMMFRNGYVPFMHVIVLLPLSALLVATTLEAVSRRLAARSKTVAAAAALAVVVAAGAVWMAPVGEMTAPHETPPLHAATLWAARNIPRDKVIVVHDAIWTDLVHHYGFQPRPVIAHKLDSDPAVAEQVHRIDYLIVPNWYYSADTAAYPTLIEARKHAVAVASFGQGDDGVEVYRVSSFWNPS